MTAIADIAEECAHCGSPLGPFAQERYCCAGCRVVAHLVRDGVQPANESSPYAVFDSDAFMNEHARVVANGCTSISLVLEGIHCASCLWTLERLPTFLPGVAEARLDVGRSALHVTYDGRRVSLSRIADTLAAMGYPPHPDRAFARDAMRRAADRAMLTRLGVAAACSGNVMMLAVALYAGESSGMDASVTTFLRWASLVATLPVMLYSADGFFRAAWHAVRTRTPHIDLALALSLGAGFVHGGINTVRNSGQIYFDSVAALVFALLASRYVFRKRQRAATDATETLQALTPLVARRCAADGRTEQVAVSALAVGDVVEVREAEVLPVDGRVEDGQAAISESLLNGESCPLAVGVGRHVHAGTQLVEGCVRVSATAVGAETRVARLMQAASDAAMRKPRVIQVADRLSVVFVVAVIGLALAAVAVGWSRGADVAVGRAIALLIVACPCALGLATPLTLASAMGQAAQRRILIKSADALERLADATAVVFDKTGTLTTGIMAVAYWFGERDAQRLVGALEARSKHPIGVSLAAAYPSTAPALAVTEVPGSGVRGIVDGHRVVVGSPDYVATVVPNVGAWMAVAADLARSGATPVAIAVNDTIVAVAGLTDTLHADARDTIERLRAAGVAVQLLSGDNPHVVERLARAAGIRVFEGGATPERKLAVVRDLGARGSVAMVGDGVNDAAALAAANVGIAVHGGAEASLAVADVYVDRPGIGAIADMVVGSRRALGTVHLGFVCGLVYNILGVTLAIAGVVTPLMAAIIMPASSLTVLTLAYRRRSFGGVS